MEDCNNPSGQFFPNMLPARAQLVSLPIIVQLKITSLFSYLISSYLDHMKTRLAPLYGELFFSDIPEPDFWSIRRTRDDHLNILDITAQLFLIIVSLYSNMIHTPKKTKYK